jgi:hypothetical protein
MGRSVHRCRPTDGFSFAGNWSPSTWPKRRSRTRTRPSTSPKAPHSDVPKSCPPPPDSSSINPSALPGTLLLHVQRCSRHRPLRASSSASPLFHGCSHAISLALGWKLFWNICSEWCVDGSPPSSGGFHAAASHKWHAHCLVPYLADHHGLGFDCSVEIGTGKTNPQKIGEWTDHLGLLSQGCLFNLSHRLNHSVACVTSVLIHNPLSLPQSGRDDIEAISKT